MHNVRVTGSDVVFSCALGQTVLEAAEAAGYELPYSCRRGICQSCLCSVLSGEVDAPPPEAGRVLLCQAKALTDLEIAPRQLTKIDHAARKTVAAKVLRITRPTDDVAVIQLRFPAGTRVKFRGGQYLEVILDDGTRRSFSMANPPQQSDGATLHVRLVPGGRFSHHVLSQVAAGTTLRLELPFGDFYLRDGLRPAVLVASGTGFAPIKSMLEDAFKRDVQRPFFLYWGGRRPIDLYQIDLPQKWAAEHSGFRFVPVVSDAEDGDGWQGRTGFVHCAVLEDFGSLADCEVYACGVVPMVTAARRDFVAERGLPPESFYCDAFVTPADAVQPILLNQHEEE